MALVSEQNIPQGKYDQSRGYVVDVEAEEGDHSIQTTDATNVERLVIMRTTVQDIEAVAAGDTAGKVY